MGHQPLFAAPPPAAPPVRPLAALRAYAAHEDPATAMANVVALVLGWNGPLYPLYVIALIGRRDGAPAFLTMLAMPLFLAVPALSRRSGTGARAALALVGTANTIWCMKLLGPASGVGLFLLPCIALAALLFHRGERGLFLIAAILPLAALLVPGASFGAPILHLRASQTHRLAALNLVSVACLTFLFALRFARLLAAGGAERAG